MKLLESPESGKQLKACHSESEPGIANATPDNRKHRLLNYEEQGGVLCATFTIDYNLHPYCVAWICIATHLLQSGMTLEEVSQFLGHSSLESTQIYTHLAHE